MNKMNKADFEILAKQSAMIASNKKAEDAVILDVSALTHSAYFFAIVEANSAPQISAVCDEVEKQFKESGILPLRIEGKNSAVWRVMDYGGLIIHIMTEQIRHTYKIEEFWKEAPTVDFMPKAAGIENQNGQIGQNERVPKLPLIKTAKKTPKKIVRKNEKRAVPKKKPKPAKKIIVAKKPRKIQKTIKPAKTVKVVKAAKTTKAAKAVKKTVKKPLKKPSKKSAPLRKRK